MRKKTITFILIFIVSNVYSQEIEFTDLIKLLDLKKTEIDSFFTAKNYRTVNRQKQDCENLMYLLEEGEKTNYYSINLCPKENNIEFYSDDKKYIDYLKSLIIKNSYLKINYENELSNKNKNFVDFYIKGQFQIYFISSKDTLDKNKLISIVKDHLVSNKIIEVEQNDKEMNQAMIQAKSTFQDFDRALKNKSSKYKNFMLKKAFNSNQGIEYVWLAEIKYNSFKDKFIGIIVSDPLYETEIKVGELVEIDKKEISDWMFVDENNLVYGGYTLKILRNRLNEKEKKWFDEENNLKFK